MTLPRLVTDISGEGRPQLDAPPRYGWRYWHIDTAADGPALINPMMPSGERTWIDAFSPAASCALVPRHRPPAPDCHCGYRFVERLDDLVRSLPRYNRHQRLQQHVAVGRVEPVGVGRVELGTRPISSFKGDPPRTGRAGSLVILGPIYVSPATSEPRALALAQRYRVEVVRTAAPDLSKWYAELQDLDEAMS